LVKGTIRTYPWLAKTGGIMTFSYTHIEEFNSAFTAFVSALTNKQTWNEVDISQISSWASRPSASGGTSYIILGINYDEEVS
jgi:uncharacterized protein YjaZ